MILITICLVLLINYGTIAEDSTTYGSVPKQPRIIVIGAGASGIAAASKLFEAGFQDVTIIEAENRIGGRVYTTEFGNYFVDIGGQWVHGEKGNAAYELAAPLGLLDKTDKPNYGLSLQFFDSEGNPLDEETENILLEFYLKYIEKDPKKSDLYKSIEDYVDKMFDNMFQNNSKIYKDKKKYLHHFETFRNTLEPADSWHDISLEDGGHEDYEGDQLLSWKSRGYSTVLDVLMKKLPDPEKELPVKNNTILNSPVTAIDYISNREGPPVLVTTTNGQLFKADHVIVTVSLGVLKAKHKSFFIPRLPKEKVKTIESLGYGNIAKIFILFDKPFWNLGESRSLFLNLLWNEADRQAIENDPEKSWLLGMTSAVTVDKKPNLLLLFVTGKYAKDMETLSDEQVFNHTKENLHRFFDKTLKVSKPLAMIRSKWYSNPNFRGTYSYRSVDAQKQQVYPDILEKPLNPQNLTVLFAGEATSMTRFSTVDGAIGSGWKAANRLIDYYKDKLPFDN